MWNAEEYHLAYDNHHFQAWFQNPHVPLYNALLPLDPRVL